MAFRDLIPWSRQENRLPVSISAERETQDHPLVTLQREMNQLFDNVFRGFNMPSIGMFDRAFGWPSLELSETDKDIRIVAEVPGLEEKDVEILVEDGALTLRGERRSEVDDKERGYSERSYGRFERRVGLPNGIEADKASATLKNGVLTITLPRSEAANENVRRIPVNGKAA